MKSEIFSQLLDNGDTLIILKDGTKIIQSKQNLQQNCGNQLVIRRGKTKHGHKYIVGERKADSPIMQKDPDVAGGKN